MATIDETTTGVWLADSRALHHTNFDAAHFTTYKPRDKPYIIRQVQGEVKITLWGTVDLITEIASGFNTLHLDEVLHIPSMTFILLSLQRLIDGIVTPIFNIIPSKAVLSKLL